ncbi:hypothetical protein [Vibrio mexicanus]|uniref:hypothetical protein n=1 Tax=Vibrio mexicanus TaxID=1004326 RepID=UPI000A70592C|nr:hypothetical protein [Vibrio mexicanus]
MKIKFERLKILINQLRETEANTPETQAARTYACGLAYELKGVKNEQDISGNRFELLYQSMPKEMIERAQSQLLKTEQIHMAEKWQKLISHFNLRHEHFIHH